MSEHTPEPWFPITLGPEVTGDRPCVIVSCSWPDIIEVCRMANALTATLAEQEANASLIARAPGLLAENKRLRAALARQAEVLRMISELPIWLYHEAPEAARAAIEAAKREQKAK